jgi:phosphatidylglycerophosphatase A
MIRLPLWTATLGPLGWWPFGPGTLTSALVTAAWWWAAPSRTATLVAAAAIGLIGAVVAGPAERALGPDDGRIVIDEAAGMALALTGVSHGVTAAVFAFVSFRVLDIAKPPPVSWCERVRGGPGVMLDDVAAGLLAALIGAAVFAAWPALE